jgi:hypothetical protein
MVCIGIRVRELKEYPTGVEEIILQQVVQSLSLTVGILNEFIWIERWASKTMNEPGLGHLEG